MPRDLRPPFALAASAAALTLVAAVAVGQFPRGMMPWDDALPDETLGKNNVLLRRALADVTADAADSTIPLFVDNGEGEPTAAAYGIVATADGIVISKASELDATVTALVPQSDGEQVRVSGTILEVDPVNDLASVQLDLPAGVHLDPVTFDDPIEPPAAGTWLVSVDADPDGPGGDIPSPVAIGNASVAGTRLIPTTGLQLGIAMLPAGQGGIPVVRVRRGSPAEAAGLQAGDLIVERDGTAVGSRNDFVNRLRFDRPSETFVLTVSRNGEVVQAPVRLEGGRLGIVVGEAVAGVTVAETFMNSPAMEAGIQPLDLITAVNEETVVNGEDLRRLLSGIRAGGRVQIHVLREGRPITVDVQVGDSARSPRARLQNALGGSTLNRRASDFPAVLQHDTVLPANEMGGPLVDLEGRIVGMNIARAGRVETYALPASVLAKVVPTLLDGVPNETPAE